MSFGKVVIVVLMTIFCSLGHADSLNKNSSPQQIPFKKEGEVSPSQLFRIAGAFLFVIALAVGGIYVLRKYLPGVEGRRNGEGKRVRLLEVRRLTPKTLLFLVEVDGKTLLLSQYGERLSVVYSGEAPPESQ